MRHADRKRCCRLRRPVVQQLKGVIEEQGAFKGDLITTSRFSKEAKESAEQSSKIVLVDMEGLLAWHAKGRRTYEREVTLSGPS